MCRRWPAATGWGEPLCGADPKGPAVLVAGQRPGPNRASEVYGCVPGIPSSNGAAGSAQGDGGQAYSTLSSEDDSVAAAHAIGKVKTRSPHGAACQPCLRGHAQSCTDTISTMQNKPKTNVQEPQQQKPFSNVGKLSIYSILQYFLQSPVMSACLWYE